MRKIRKRLTQQQIDRGVIFSSCLSTERTEQSGDNVHEVLKGDLEATETIERLLNDSFFNGSPWNYNIIREVS